MITAHKKHHGKRLPLALKRNIGIESLKEKATIVDISNRFNVSRNSVYKQQARALTAVNQAFEQTDDEVLYYIPVTKAYIHRAVTALYLVCRAGSRDIMSFMGLIFDYSVSIGTVSNILDKASDEAITINNQYDLASIQTGCSDELFHHNKPLLATVDIESRFCPLLVHADHRDYETWGIHLLDLQARGYNPESVILDGAKGLIKGYEEALPETAIQHDHFHFIMDMKDCGRYLKNRVDSATTAAMKLFQQSVNGRDEAKKQTRTEAFEVALNELSALETVHTTFKTLSSWMQYDVLQLAGKPPIERAILYDFIQSEMTNLALAHPHRIEDIVTSLKTRRDALLDVTNTLNDKFMTLSEKHHVSIDIIWSVCYLARYAFDSLQYGLKSNELESLIGSKYDEIEDDVLHILETTHRCSSMVENFNSRLRPYLDKRKFITPKRLALILFYLNHKPFARSKHAWLVNKTPAEAMTGKPHEPWLGMLGFDPVKRQRA